MAFSTAFLDHIERAHADDAFAIGAMVRAKREGDSTLRIGRVLAYFRRPGQTRYMLKFSETECATFAEGELQVLR